jgi:alpha-beta hydrolase superfamily lysophospholipase
MDRREFLRTAKVIAAGAGASSALSTVGLAASERAPAGPPVMRRFNEQRWALDNIIQANGIDWDQGRTGGLIRACGASAIGDMATLRQRVKKFADIAPAFESLARRREAMAKEAEHEGETFEARDNYYIAAQYWASGMWPIDEVNDRINRYNDKKRETFSKFMQLADHKIEWADIPYRGKQLPGVFHLPPNYQAGQKVPVIVMVPGMDGYKEKYVSLYGDPWMQRGFAFLAIEGPGYWEAPLRGLYVDVPGWVETGKEIMKWLMARPEIDADKIAVVGSSFGSFFSAIMMSEEPRYKACAVTGTCYEPGGHSIFDEASPTFKHRFMFMSGITDEREFEEFRKTLDWHGYAEKVKVPYLIAGGEADELCPLENTEAFVKALGGPKQLIVYADARHSIGGVPSAANGPETRSYQAKWLQARLAGKPFSNEYWFVQPSGKIDKRPL